MPTATRHLHFTNPHASYDRYHPRHRYDIMPIDDTDQPANCPHGYLWRLWDALDQRFIGPTFRGRYAARLYKRHLSQDYERQFDL